MVAQRTARKWLLGREIDHMITTAGLSQTEAAALIETRQSRIADLISGTATIALGDLERLANKLGFTDVGYQEVLLELRRDNHKRGFWTTGHNRAYAEDFRLMVDLEKHADLLRVVQAELVPGLAQCEAYVRALHQGLDEVDGVNVEEAVQARLARQEVLLKDNPPEFRAVLSESCLRREFGGPQVIQEQIKHLIELSERPNIQIQIMPFATTTRRAGMEDRFVLVRVPSPGVAGPLELAYVESQGDIRYLDDKAAFTQRESVWSRLSADALNTDDSVTFMKRISTSFSRKTFAHGTRR